MILEFKLTIDTNKNTFDVINTTTGEVKELTIPVVKKRTSSKKIKDENPNPQIILEDNKYTLNTAAVELMEVEPDDKLDIKYEKNGSNLIPIIGKNTSFGTKAGNRVTKSFTVSCRGKANEELSEYGDIFDIKPHSEKENIFILVGNKEIKPIKEDENIKIDSEEIEEIIPLDINDLVDNPEEASEVTSATFDFTTL